jgi:hypothetical protein
MSEDGPVTHLAERLAAPLSRLAPPSAAEAKKLQKQLMHAGFRSESAPIIYRGIQFMVMAGLPAIVALGRVLAAKMPKYALL